MEIVPMTKPVLTPASPLLGYLPASDVPIDGQSIIKTPVISISEARV